MSELASPAGTKPLAVDARTLALVGAIAFVAAAPSLLNGFAYDDNWIIVNNGRVHSLERWADWFRTSYWPTYPGSLYRPLTTTAFAFEWWIGRGTPFVFHLVNVLLYVAGAVVFTRLAGLVLPALAAIVAGALFAVHPVHVEAVANSVGQSELSAGLVMLAATFVYVRARRAGPLTRKTMFALTALYLAGALLKEHGLTLPAWFVVAELTVLRGDTRTLRVRLAELAPLLGLLTLVAVLALVVRLAVLGVLSGDVPHPAIRDASFSARMFVMLGVLPDLARLLVWPVRLYADYSPEHVFVSTEPSLTQLNGVFVALGVLLMTVVAWRRSAPAAFGMLIAAAAWLPTANILFPSGILLSERTLYLPTAGVLLAAGSLFAWVDHRFRTDAQVRGIAAAALGVVLVLGIARSVQRSRAWRSSDDIFWTMRRDEPMSFRAHYAWGAVLFERKDLAGGEKEWLAAIRIFPNHPFIYEDLAHQYRQHHFCPAALPMYEKALELDQHMISSRQGLVACQLGMARFSDARRTARLGVINGVVAEWFRKRVFSADSALAATDSVSR